MPDIESPTAMNHLFVGKSKSGRNRLVAEAPRIKAQASGHQKSGLLQKQLQAVANAKAVSKSNRMRTGKSSHVAPKTEVRDSDEEDIGREYISIPVADVKIEELTNPTEKNVSETLDSSVADEELKEGDLKSEDCGASKEEILSYRNEERSVIEGYGEVTDHKDVQSADTTLKDADTTLVQSSSCETLDEESLIPKRRSRSNSLSRSWSKSADNVSCATDASDTASYPRDRSSSEMSSHNSDSDLSTMGSKVTNGSGVTETCANHSDSQLPTTAWVPSEIDNVSSNENAENIANAVNKEDVASVASNEDTSKHLSDLDPCSQLTSFNPSVDEKSLFEEISDQAIMTINSDNVKDVDNCSVGSEVTCIEVGVSDGLSCEATGYGSDEDVSVTDQAGSGGVGGEEDTGGGGAATGNEVLTGLTGEGNADLPHCISDGGDCVNVTDTSDRFVGQGQHVEGDHMVGFESKHLIDVAGKDIKDNIEVEKLTIHCGKDKLEECDVRGASNEVEFNKDITNDDYEQPTDSLVEESSKINLCNVVIRENELEVKNVPDKMESQTSSSCADTEDFPHPTNPVSSNKSDMSQSARDSTDLSHSAKDSAHIMPDQSTSTEESLAGVDADADHHLKDADISKWVKESGGGDLGQKKETMSASIGGTYMLDKFGDKDRGYDEFEEEDTKKKDGFVEETLYETHTEGYPSEDGESTQHSSDSKQHPSHPTVPYTGGHYEYSMSGLPSMPYEEYGRVGEARAKTPTPVSYEGDDNDGHVGVTLVVPNEPSSDKNSLMEYRDYFRKEEETTFEDYSDSHLLVPRDEGLRRASDPSNGRASHGCGGQDTSDNDEDSYDVMPRPLVSRSISVEPTTGEKHNLRRSSQPVVRKVGHQTMVVGNKPSSNPPIGADHKKQTHSSLPALPSLGKKNAKAFNPFPVKHFNSSRAKTGLKLGLYTSSTIDKYRGMKPQSPLS